MIYAERCASLEDRPAGDPELEARLDRVEALAGEGVARAEVETQAAMLAELRETLSELEARPVGSPGIDERLEEVRNAVAALAERPAVDEGVRGRVEELASRLETLVDGAALDDLRGALRELEGRPAGDPELEARLDRVEALAGEGVARAEVEAQAAMLAELRETLSELEARPVGSPGIDERLERIESALIDQQIIVDDTSALDTLAARIDMASDMQEDLIATIETLSARIENVNSLAERPVTDETARDRVEELASRLETLVDGAALDDLRGALRELEGRPAGDPALEARLDRLEAFAGEGVARAEVELRELREALAELEDRPVDSSGIDARLERIESALLDQQIITDDTSALDALMARIDMASDVQEDLVATIETLGIRVEDVTTLADRPAADEAVRVRVDEVVSRLEGMEARLASDLVTTGDLSRALADAREDLAPVTPDQDGRIAELVQDLASVRDELARIAHALGPTPVSPMWSTRLSPGSSNSNGRSTSGSPAAIGPVGAGGRRAHPYRGRDGPCSDGHRAPRAPSRGARPGARRADALARRYPETRRARRPDRRGRRRGHGWRLAQGAGRAPTDSSADLRALMRRVDEAETSSLADREKLMNRLERMASSIDWRLQRLESDDPE